MAGDTSRCIGDAPWSGENLARTAIIERCLAAVADGDAAVQAFVEVCGQRAMRRAQAADMQQSPAPPLARFPIGVKDVIDVSGLVTRAGSHILPERPARRTAATVRAAERAGAIVIGKTTTHEFAYGAVTPPTRNPHDLSRIAGGSSGGSAAAVAAGFVRAAIGTDTGGSVRVPAALCGVFGLRPLRRSLSYSGAISLSPSYDTIGLIAGTLQDITTLAHALIGSSPYKSPVVFGAPAVPAEDLDQEVARSFDQVLKLPIGMRSLCLPPMRSWFEPRMTIQMRQALEVHRRVGWWPGRKADYSAETRHNLEVAEHITHREFVAATRTVRSLHNTLRRAFEDCQVIVAPTTPIVAPTYGAVSPTTENQQLRHPIVQQLSMFTLPFATGDLTSLTIPWTTSALPVGIQLIGLSESVVLHAASRLLATA